MHHTEKLIAQELLNVQAVTLRPNNYYTWASGLRAPIYCDNRLTLSYPRLRRLIARSMADVIRSQFGQVDVIAGTATAGIPHAAWVSELLKLPMIYVRNQQKKHGKTNQVEGVVHAGQKVVVIEDLISTGMSSVRVVETLQALDCQVLGVVAIFTYGIEQAAKQFDRVNVLYYSLTNFDTLLTVAAEQEYIEKSDIDHLKTWRDQL